MGGSPRYAVYLLYSSMLLYSISSVDSFVDTTNVACVEYFMPASNLSQIFVCIVSRACKFYLMTFCKNFV